MFKKIKKLLTISKLPRKTFVEGMLASLAGVLVSTYNTHWVSGKGANKPEYNDDWEPGEYRLISGTCTFCGSLCGFQARQVELGRRIVKLEGEKSHPVNKGALCLKGQASLQHIYNPERLKVHKLKSKGMMKNVSIEAVANETKKLLEKAKNPWLIMQEPDGLVSDLLMKFAKKYHLQVVNEFPAYQQGKFEKISNANSEPYIPLSKNKYILMFDGSLIEESNYSMSILKEIGNIKTKNRVSKVVTFTSRVSLSANQSDLIYIIKPGSGFSIAMGLINLLKPRNIPNKYKAILKEAKRFTPAMVHYQTGLQPVFLQKIAKDLKKINPALAVSVFSINRYPTDLALAEALIALNVVLKNSEGKATFQNRTDRISIWGEALAPTLTSKQIYDEWRKKKPDFIFHVSGDPAFHLPKDNSIKKMLKEIPIVSIYPYSNETNQYANVLVNATLPYEEHAAYVSNASLNKIIFSAQKPLCPLKDGRIKRVDFILSLMEGKSSFSDEADYYDKTISKISKLTQKSADELEKIFFQKGFVTLKAKADPLKFNIKTSNIKKAIQLKPQETKNILVPFQTVAIGDGTFNHIPWLRDLGGVHIHEHWYLFAEMHPEMLEKLKLHNKEVVKIKKKNDTFFVVARVRENLLISPQVVGLPLGFGKQNGGIYSKSKNPENIERLNLNKITEEFVEIEIEKV